MEYKFKLIAANRKITIDFSLLESKYHIFSKAAENCNAGITFKNDRKKIIIEDIKSDCIYLNLFSSSILPSPTRTLSAYSRELIRIDKENGCLNSIIYNHTLFSIELLESVKNERIKSDDITYPELLKAIIDILYNPSNIYNATQKKKAISQIKEIMLPFIEQGNK